MPKEKESSLLSVLENKKGKYHSFNSKLSRDELYKRRRGFGATGQALDQPLQDEMDVGGAVDDNIDFEKYTI